jgi:NHL repeat-containing protein
MWRSMRAVILDTGHQRIRRVDQATGFIDTVVGTGLTGFVGDRGPRQGGSLSNPSGSTYDATGNLYVADPGDRAVRRIAADGTITTFAGDGTANGLGDGGPAVLASLSSPQDVLVVGTNLFIADVGSSRIRAVDLTTGLIRTYASVSAPVAIIADASGVLYVAHDNQVDTVDQAGAVTPFAGTSPVDTPVNPLGDGLPAANATLSSPSGLALDAAGELFIADTGNNLIRKIGAAPGLVVSTVAGGGTQVFPSVGDGGAATNATLSSPVGVAVDSTRILIADSGDYRIRSVDLGTGIITTICGDGTAGLDGDGDLAANAEVNSPGRIVFKGPNLVIADTGNNRIREIVPALDMNPKLLRLSASLNFAVDKKTGQIARGKDTLSVKTALALPGGISAANLEIHVDIVDLHQQEQFDANGKPPRLVKPAPVVTSPFGFIEPIPPQPLASRYSFPFKGVSVAGRKPVPFTFSSAGTLREELGRAGFSNITTPKAGVNVPVRVNITIGPVTFTGVAATTYKATQGKGGLVVTPTPR